MIQSAKKGKKPTAATGGQTSTNGTNGTTASVLQQFIPAFERLNGRSPTSHEQKEALAFHDVVHASGIDPFLIFYLADKRAQDARERVPSEMRAIIAEARTALTAGELSPKALAAVEAAVARGRAGGTGSKGWRQAPEWRGLLAVVGAVLFVFLLAAVSITSGVATRNRDLVLAREMSTSSGVAALALARANPDLASILAACPRDFAQPAMTCRLRPIGTRVIPPRSTWISTAVAVVSDWSSVWLTLALGASMLVIIALSLLKRGPIKKRIA